MESLDFALTFDSISALVVMMVCMAYLYWTHVKEGQDEHEKEEWLEFDVCGSFASFSLCSEADVVPIVHSQALDGGRVYFPDLDNCNYAVYENT